MIKSAIILTAVFSCFCLQAATADSIELITKLEYTADLSDEPPEVNAEWQSIELPRGSRHSAYKKYPRHWYRFTLIAPTDDKMRALYFWRYNSSLTVFMNGTEIGGDTFVEGRHTLSWNHPRLVPIQPSNWKPGQNEILIRFNNSPFGGSFVTIAHGPESELRQIFEERMFWNIRTNEWILVFGVLVMMLAAVLWLIRRNDTIYLWFIGLCAAWTIVTIHMVVYHNLISYEVWLPLVHIAIDTWCYCTFVFASRLMRFNLPWAHRCALSLFILAAMSHLFSPRDSFWMFAYLFHLAWFGLLAYLTGHIILRAVQRRDFTSVSVCAGLAGQVLLIGSDMRLFFFGEQVDWANAVHVSHFGLPLIIAVFTANLLIRFTEALKVSEQLNQELESRVEAGRQALEQSYQENRELELAQAAAQERHKIYRDIHDDVGSKLASMVHTDNQETLHQLARSALDGVREAVYSANYADENLIEYLLRIREETQLRLNNAGIQLTWFEDPDLENHVLSSNQCYQLSRILRELTSNVIHHSDAALVTVNWEKLNNAYQFEFSDNGVGFDENAASGGNGLANIRSRSQEMGGAIAWQRLPQGISITMTFDPEFITPDSPVASDPA